MMKTMMIVSLLAAQMFVSGVAMAGVGVPRTRPEDRGMTAYPGSTLSPQHLFCNGNECAGERASAVFGAGGQTLGYECLNSANG